MVAGWGPTTTRMTIEMACQKDILLKRRLNHLMLFIQTTGLGLYAGVSRQANGLGQWFLKCGPWTCSISTTWDFVRSAASHSGFTLAFGITISGSEHSALF